MNSIRSLIHHLSEIPGFQTISFKALAEAYSLDGELLENGSVVLDDLATFPFWNCSFVPVWVVIYKEKVFGIISFILRKEIVYIYLAPFIIGQRVSMNASAPYELLSCGPEMKLANCSVGTYKWLETHPVTAKMIERMKKPLA